MELKTFSDHASLSAAAASMIIACVKRCPGALLCLATGDTPKLTYQMVVEYAKQEGISFEKCFFIGLDEWLGIPPENSGSCHYFLHTHIFKPLGIHPSQVYLFDALTRDEEAECEKMNKLIAEKGPVDLMLVGVGMNGHVGFNEPGTGLDTITHVAILDEVTRSVGQKYFQEKVSISKGITVGLKQVMQAKNLLMLANGKKKAPVIQQVVKQEISPKFPATIIRMHQNGILMIDSEAASAL